MVTRSRSKARTTTLKPGSKALILLLALLTAIGPLSTDMYLPSLPAIGTALATDTRHVQLTLSVFIAGFAVGQIIYGPLSDRYGRKPVMLAAMTLFLAGSIMCTFAQSIDQLTAARFIQAIGGCGPVVLARAIVRDFFAGSSAARLLSFMGALMGLVPAIAPVLGSLLQVYFGWRANFAVMTIISVGLLINIIILLPESLHQKRQTNWSASSMLKDFAYLLQKRIFIRYLLAVCLGYAGLFAFISGSSFVLQSHYGLSELAFGFSFGLCVTGYITGTLIGARMTGRKGIDYCIWWGTVVLAAASVALLVWTFLTPYNVWAVLVPILFYGIGIGLVLPQSTAGGLTPFPEMAGTASSLLGFCQMSSAALTGIALGYFIDSFPYALVMTLAFMGIANFLVSLSFSGKRRL